MIGGPRTRVFVIQDSTDHREAKVFRAHTAPQGTCDNLINALKLLTNQQNDGDSPVGKIVSWLAGEQPQQNNGRALEVHCS